MYEDCLVKKESNIYGLKYIPSIEPKFSDTSDYIELTRNVTQKNGNGQFSDADYEVAKREFQKIKDQCKCILEIGVAFNFGKSSTELWLTEKNDDCFYFGVDIDLTNKKHHEEFKPNVHMLLKNSKTEMDQILSFMKENGCEQIDVLFIDGDHSIDLVINDWKYAELVRPGGLILMHDTSVHPGPHLVFDAIDENLFTKEKYFQDKEDDWGIAVVWKK